MSVTAYVVAGVFMVAAKALAAALAVLIVVAVVIVGTCWVWAGKGQP